MAKRVARMAMWTALAMVFSYVEAIIPFSFGVQGVKLGLANIVVLAGLYMMPAKDVFVISMTRIVLMGLLFYNGITLLYSLCGGILSFVVMYFLKKISAFSILGVSAAGAVAHNTGQIIAAYVIIQNVSVFAYFPVLIVSGVVMGIITGVVLKVVMPYIHRLNRN